MSVFMHELVANEMHLAMESHTLVDVDHSTQMIAALCRLHGDTPEQIRITLIEAALERGIGFVFANEKATTGIGNR